mgnify:CR=1 FL=1
MVQTTVRRIAEDSVRKLPRVKQGYVLMYSCMFPIESPEFKRPQDVMAWYAGLEQKQKLEFKKAGGFIISQLSVACNDCVVGGESFRRGDVIEEVDSFKFDFKLAKWIKC